MPMSDEKLQRKWTGVLAIAVTGAAALVWSWQGGTGMGARQAWGQAQPADEQDDQAAEDAPSKADGDKPPEKKDPADLRNSIGNLDLVRGFQQVARPVKK